MENKNTCDKCEDEDFSSNLIWIDTEDFRPLKDDDYNSVKHQEAVEIFNYSALCLDCYKTECCGGLAK